MDNSFHHKGGGQALNVRQRGKALIVKLLERWQISSDDVEKVIRLPKKPLSLHYLRDLLKRDFECFNRPAIALAKHYCGAVVDRSDLALTVYDFAVDVQAGHFPGDEHSF